MFRSANCTLILFSFYHQNNIFFKRTKRLIFCCNEDLFFVILFQKNGKRARHGPVQALSILRGQVFDPDEEQVKEKSAGELCAFYRMLLRLAPIIKGKPQSSVCGFPFFHFKEVVFS